MSEVPAPDAEPAKPEASSEAAPPPESPPDTGADVAPPRKRPRVAFLAALAVVVVGAAIWMIVRARHHRAEVVAGSGDGGRGAVRAPPGPNLPDDPNSVHLMGFVVDGAGLPVAGAEVSAELEHGAPDRALAIAPADAGVGVDAGADDAGVTIASSPPTAADGRFVITGIVPGRYRVRVSGAGLLAAEIRYVPVPSDATRIIVARQVSIEGTVTDGGKPVPLVPVAIRGDAIGGTYETRTDPTGAFKVPALPEGRYQVYAWQGPLAARTVRVNRLGAGPFPPVELRLEAGAIVVGRVIDREEGTGLVAAIELRPSGDDQAPRYARSGDDGVFRIEGVPNGRWIADAFAPGYLSAAGVELEAGKGIPELALSRGATIEGKVVDGDGRPIEGASVRALVGATNPTEASEQVDKDRLRRFSGRTAALVPDVATGADPQFLPRGELGVMLGPIPPIPPPGAQVAQTAALVDASLVGEPPPLVEDPARASIWRTGPDGRYRIRGLAKGKIVALAIAPGFAEARAKPVTLGAGELAPNIDIVLTPGTMLVGRITNQRNLPIAGALITAQPEVGAPVTAFTDGSGEYQLGPVTGKLALHASAYGHVDVDKQLELPATRGTTPAEKREDIVLFVADAILAGTLDDTTGATVSGAHLEVLGADRHGVVSADGTFLIDMLPPGNVRVRVTHPDYPVTELEAVATTTGERSRLKLPLGGAIEGALLDNTSGSPLASMTITATGPAGATAEATTDKDGRWKLGPLKPGKWTISAKLPGYLAHERTVDVPVSRAPGATSVRDVRIDLARGALVGGTVRDKRGQRVASAHVVVKGGSITVEGDTDAQGEFRLRDAPTGDLVVTATRGDEVGTVKVTIRPGSEVLGLAIEIK